MWVSEWRVPLMNVTPEMIGQSPALRTASSAPRPFSTVMTVASGNRPRSDSAAASSPPALVATMPRSNGGERGGVCRGPHVGLAVAAPADAEPFALERRCVVGPAGQDRDVRDRGQMAREQAADRSRSDDAHALHAVSSPFPKI